VNALLPPLHDFAALPKKAIHCRDRAQIDAFIQESGVNLWRGQVHETLGMKF
jgi:hypothetical protein